MRMCVNVWRFEKNDSKGCVLLIWCLFTFCSNFICMCECVIVCLFVCLCAILLINNNQIVLNFISINCGNVPGYYWPRRNFHYISRGDAAPAGASRRTDAAGLHLGWFCLPDRTPACVGWCRTAAGGRASPPARTGAVVCSGRARTVRRTTSRPNRAYRGGSIWCGFFWPFDTELYLVYAPS